jgi:hypothetical protein
MTHNRRPDVLPVEGASIAEALEALEKLDAAANRVPANARDFAVIRAPLLTIRSALERAAAEGEARELTLRDGNDEPWSLREVLAKLVESADILLHQKDYDGAHWELIQSAWEHGKHYLAAPPKGPTA